MATTTVGTLARTADLPFPFEIESLLAQGVANRARHHVGVPRVAERAPHQALELLDRVVELVVIAAAAGAGVRWQRVRHHHRKPVPVVVAADRYLVALRAEPRPAR